MKKKICVFLLLILLSIGLIYICDIDNLPENIVLFEGEKLNLKTIYGVSIETVFSSNPNIERIENNKAISVSANAESDDCTGNLKLDVSFIGIKVKEINAEIIKNAEVVPLRNISRCKIIYLWSISCWNV